MKFSDYAKSIGKTRGYVHKLYIQGRLDKAIYMDMGRKRINKDIANAILNGLSNKNLSTSLETNSEGRYTNRYTNKNNCIDTSNTSQSINDSEFESLTYDQARRMKVYYEAQLEKFHLEKEKGKYLLAEDVKKDAFRAGLIFRDKVLAVPSQVASDLSDMTSEFDIQNFLHGYLTAAIEDALNFKHQSTTPLEQKLNNEKRREEQDEQDEEQDEEAVA